MARISKDPEVRKQEIIEAAMVVFYEKGYDKTKMSDIADKIGVAQGLCYRYFPSKEALYDSAIEQYAFKLATPLQKVINDNSLTLQQKLARLPGFMDVEKKDDPHYQMFHDENSKKIHDQLSLKVCEIMKPFVSDAMKQAHDKGETDITDYDTAASFVVYGQLGVLLDETISGTDRVDRIRIFLNYLLDK